MSRALPPRGTRARAISLIPILMILCCGVALAQSDLHQPPEKGGTTYSLGMPPVYKGFSGFEIQSFRTSNDFTELAIFLNLGVSKDLGSPIVGIGALSLEGYGGYRGTAFDGGARASFSIPSLMLGFGADWNGTDGDIVGLFRLDFPLRRGGVFGRGTTVAIRWLPAREQTWSLGVNSPLWGRNLGATRPKRDNVRLDERKPTRWVPEEVETALSAELENLRERARWVSRLSQPFAEHSGADPQEAMQPTLDLIQAHIDSTDTSFAEGHHLPAEIAAYHLSLERAFSIASSTVDDGQITDMGREASAEARRILVDEVLLPYNRLLGQRKKNDSLLGLAAIAQTEFGSWVLSNPASGQDLNEEQVRLTWFVYQTVCDIMEEIREELKDRWEDSRFVWLPLEFGFKPEEHDTQREMDAILERAVKQPLAPDNNVWYVINEQFQREMHRSVREAEDYHVLWIHDYRGKTPAGKPDVVGAAQTLNYIQTLAARVRAFDDTGQMPTYLILLDQLYFESNKGRDWLRILTKPLDEDISLPDEFVEWETQLRAAQDELREAIEGSLTMRLGRSQYGEKWVKNLIKVHVNITNPVDMSFRSWHSAGIIPVPDSIMRDHRKIFFYDITEEDPYKGMALFTGMGIGEHYTGPNWEDRAIMVQGPGALQTKTAARELLLAQGFETHEIPHPLRALPKPRSYEDRIDEKHAELPDWMRNRGGVLQLHNETGFHDKPVNVAKAVLYNLMPTGSVLKVPDSLWQSYIYASLLSGSAMRGCRVLIIAPTLASAPSAASPTMARAHGLMGRLIVLSNDLDDEMSRHGGLLKVGLYAPKQGVGDIAGRMQQSMVTSEPWMSRIYPDSPNAERWADTVPALLDSIGYSIEYLTDTETEEEIERNIEPKLHLKANFFASSSAWEKLVNRPEMVELFRLYTLYLAEQSMTSRGGEDTSGVQNYPEDLADLWIGLAEGLMKEATPQEREELIYYLTVGSTNMDYRSMVMDGEVMTTISGWQALYGFIDFIMLGGLCEWLETTEQLDALLPPPGGMTRSMAGLIRLAL